MKKSLLITLLSLLGMASCLQAAVLVTLGEAKPTENVMAGYTPNAADIGNSTVYRKGDGNYRDAGQAFSVTGSSFEMSAVTMKIFSVNNPTALQSKNFSINIYALNAVNSLPNPATDLVSSQQGTLPSTSLVAGNYITFTLGQSVTMTSGKAYLVMFSFDDATSSDSSTNYLSFERSNSNAAYGRLWLNTNGTFSADTKAFDFAVQSTAVPEPATAAFFLLSGALLACTQARIFRNSKRRS